MAIPVTLIQALAKVEEDLGATRRNLEEILKSLKFRRSPKAMDCFIAANRSLRDCNQALGECCEKVMKGYIHERKGE